jgi:hypothetical protein
VIRTVGALSSKPAATMSGQQSTKLVIIEMLLRIVNS